MKKKLFFVITQFYKGGAEMALLNLFKSLSPEEYEVDLLIHDQVYLPKYVNLINKLPSWMRTCNASDGELKLISYVKKAYKKIKLRITKKLFNRRKAEQFVKDKHYDIAFNYGEWMPPEFVAKVVQADKKYNWIHSDLDKVEYLDPQVFWPYDKFYDGYIFVSNASLNASLEAFPVLRNRTCIIHNLCDEEEIKSSSQKSAELPELQGKHLLVTVANFRPAKNHLRQLEVMRLLEKQECKIVWLNIGGKVDMPLYNKLKSKIKEYGLEESFILMESDPNPYKYMAHADAVTVLSEYESWSMVITEAKILGVPVIATPTSGALEQIQDMVNGIIVEADIGKIAEAIQNYLNDTKLQDRLRGNLKGFSQREYTSIEWNSLVGGKK